MNNSSGTDEYIEKAVATHSKRLLSAAYAVLKSTASAEDAVQETFIKLITKQPHFNDSEHEKAWLLRVTVNISLNMLKKVERNNPVTENEPVYTEDNSFQLLDLIILFAFLLCSHLTLLILLLFQQLMHQMLLIYLRNNL